VEWQSPGKVEILPRELRRDYRETCELKTCKIAIGRNSSNVQRILSSLSFLIIDNRAPRVAIEPVPGNRKLFHVTP
jgi:hypothetical protein